MLKNRSRLSAKEQLSERPEDDDILLVRNDVRALDLAASLFSNVKVEFSVGESTSTEFSEPSAMFEEFLMMIPVSRSRFEAPAYFLAMQFRNLAEPDEPSLWFFWLETGLISWINRFVSGWIKTFLCQALLEICVPVIFYLVVGSSRQASCYSGPPFTTII